MATPFLEFGDTENGRDPYFENRGWLIVREERVQGRAHILAYKSN